MKSALCCCVVWFAAMGMAGAGDSAPPDYRKFDVLNEIGAQPGGTGAVLSSDGKVLLTCGSNLNLWNVEKGTPIRCFGRDGGYGWLKCPAMSPDGKLAFACSSDKYSVLVWETETGNLLREIQTGAQDLTLLPDGSAFVSGGALWDVKSGTSKCKFVAGSGDGSIFGQIVFAADGKRCFSLNTACTFTTWDMTSGKSVGSVRVHLNNPKGLAIAPDGKTFMMSDAPGYMLLFDSAGKKLREWSSSQRPLGAPRAFFYTPDGKQLVWQNVDSIQLMDVKTWQSVKTIANVPVMLRAQAMSQDGKRVVATDEYHRWAIVWDVQSGERVAEFAGHEPGAYNPLVLAMAPDGKTFLSGDVNQSGRRPSPVIRWSLPNGRVQSVYWDPTEKNSACDATSLAFTSDGKRFLWCPKNGCETAMLWDTTKSQILKTYLPPAKSSGVRGTLSPDSQTVVISGKGTVFYNCETGEEIRSLPENAGRFVRYSPDGTTFLLHRKQIVIGKPNEHTFVLWDVASWKEIKTFKMLSKFDIGSVVFHPQEKVLAVVDSNQRVVFWDLEKGISMKTIEAPSKKDRVLSCVFAPDGKTLAMGFIGEREKGIGFWDWAAGTAIRTIRIEQGYDFRGVGMLIFSRDGKTLLVAAGAKILVLGER